MSYDERKYQDDAIESIRATIQRGIRNILLTAPTGAGKTVIASRMMVGVVLKQKRCLFLAHRRELITQTYDKLLEFGVSEQNVGIIRANEKEHRRPAALIQVASVQTLVNRTLPEADVIFVDEAHHAVAKTYRKITDQYKGKVIIGMTATPYRTGGEGLGDVYEKMILVAQPRELIALGYLVEPLVYTHPESPDLSRVHVRNGDYVEGELDAAVNTRKYVGNIVEHWLRLGRGMRTVVFAVSVAHSKRIMEAFVAAGVPAEHVDATTPLEEREAILGKKGRIATGETLILCNVNIATEGFDRPAIKVAVLARPTLSKGLFLQQSGRIMRPFENLSAIILDHAGCAIRHGRPQDDRELTLDGEIRQATGKGIAMTKTCPECFFVLHLSAKACPCGHVFSSTVQEDPVNAEGELVQRILPTHEEMRAEVARLTAIASAKNYKIGWIGHQFKAKYGFFPPKTMAPKPQYGDGDMRAEFDRLRAEAFAKGHQHGWIAARFERRFGRFPPYDWAKELQPKIEEWQL